MTAHDAAPDVTSPLVSVLIPAFNHERYVWRCLDSVLDDPYPAKELIVIDDGSTDRTGARIDDWVARHRTDIPVAYVQREHRGTAATLNELASRANGEFLRPGASDDYLLPGGLGAQVAYLLKHPHKIAVIGDSLVVDRDGHKLHDSGMCDLHGADKSLYLTDDGIRRAVIRQWAIGGPVVLLRKCALDIADRWSEGLRIEDWDLFLRLAARDGIGFIDVRVCAYRIHESNVSKTRNKGARIANLAESRRVAMFRLGLFEEPYRTLLRAQSHYIDAKVSFLERRPWPLLCHLTAYLVLVVMATLRSAGPRTERT